MRSIRDLGTLDQFVARHLPGVVLYDKQKEVILDALESGGDVDPGAFGKPFCHAAITCGVVAE